MLEFLVTFPTTRSICIETSKYADARLVPRIRKLTQMKVPSIRHITKDIGRRAAGKKRQAVTTVVNRVLVTV